MMSAFKSSALIFRTQSLARSETFIRSQAEAMTKYRPFYVGWRRVDGLELPDEASWVAIPAVPLANGAKQIPDAWPRSRMSLPASIALATSRPRAFWADACAAMPLVKRLRLPLVVTFHGYDVTVNDQTMRQWRTGRHFLAHRAALANTGAIFIAVSQFIKKRLLELNFPESRIVVHYIGVDIRKFHPTANIPREPLVLFVGRLVEKKGCSFLLNAMSQVRSRVPGARLTIVGDGPERAALEREAREHFPLAQFLGSQPPEAVRSWMARASVFCVPSVTAKDGDSEGFGIVFVEAQACGTPAVSFSSGGIPEAIAHGDTGFLAQEHDIAGLAEYISLLLSNRDLWMRFSTAGRRRVETLFDLHKQTRLLEGFYDQLNQTPSQKGSKNSAPQFVSL